MIRISSIIQWAAACPSVVFGVLTVQCALGCLRSQPGSMPHGWLWKLTGAPCDQGTLILLLAITLTFASIALFASLGRFAAPRQGERSHSDA